MKTRVLLLGCLIALASQVQGSTRELWVWKDANGVTHYSDRPVPGATRMTVSGGVPTSVAPRPAPAAKPARPAGAPAEAQQVQYTLLEIWKPASGESFFGADASVDVRIRSEPELAPGDRLLLYVDGKLVEGATNSYEHFVSGLERGAHSMAAVILDAKGNEKIRSEPRVFHMKPPTADNPRAVGPALRPPPPPPPKPKPNTPK